MRLSKKLAIAAVATVAAVGAATSAFALWSASGSGSGSAKAYTAQAITVAATASPSADTNLYPGAPGVDVTGTATNPSPYGVSFTGWTNAAVDSVDAPSADLDRPCGTSDFQIASGKTSGSFTSALAIAHNNTALATAPGVVQMKSTASDGCQGAKVVVKFDLAGGGQS